jgi:hypothetical protein
MGKGGKGGFPDYGQVVAGIFFIVLVTFTPKYFNILAELGFGHSSLLNVNLSSTFLN